MCGISGYWVPGGISEEDGRAVLERMSGAIAHRGPDGSGVWLDSQAGVGLGHRRLSILELSPAGAQPMVSRSGRFVLVLNGEIYNHSELRGELGAMHHFRGHSDTETLLACFEQWGVEHALQRAVGMFAFALYDLEQRILYLARDRAGEKPLYFGWQSGRLLFGSELKALHAAPWFQAPISRSALARYLRRGFVAGPESIYESIWKLPPATFVRIPIEGSEARALPSPTQYWSIDGPLIARSRVSDAETDVVETLHIELKRATRDQMVADVPLGAFLSGGVDSTTVVALMQAQSSLPVKTFTIGFEDAAYDEAPYAQRIARHLGTEHTECYASAGDILSVVPTLSQLYDEPFADSSQIPTAMICRIARAHVTVALSGDGGDELFGGYNRHLAMRRYWGGLTMTPRFLRQRIAPVGQLIASGLERFGPKGQAAERLRKFTRLIESSDVGSAYRGVLQRWGSDEHIVRGAEGAVDWKLPPKVDGLGAEEQFMRWDFLGYLPDDVLVKVDRAAMAHALETRAPFLDHRVVEAAWRLPRSMKIRGGKGKWVLREILRRYVPSSAIERPKAGFSVPLASWLRGPLKDWAEELLSESRLRNEGYLEVTPIRTRWEEHLSGARNWQEDLWAVLMFQQWLERTRPASAPR